MRLRKRAVGLLIGAGVLFFLATNVQAGWLFVLSAMLLGVVMVGVVMPVRATRGAAVVRRAPAEVHQGDEVFVDVIVRGGRRLTRRGLLVHDRFLEAADLWVGTVRPGEQIEITTVRIAARRGAHPAGHAWVRSGAPFGVAERRRRVEVDGPCTLVLPAIEALGQLPFVRSATTTMAAMHTVARRGQGPEYLGIRGYRAGDSMRHVHWASTARTGTMMVRELEQEQTRRLAIVLDNASDAEPDARGLTPLDRVCSAAASIALSALAHGHGARIVSGDRGHLDVLARADEGELLEHLALIEPTPGVNAFPDVLAGAAGSLRGVETAVLVFPTWSGNDAGALAPRVASLAERVATVVAVPVMIGSSRRAALNDERVDGLCQRLRAAGAVVHPWKTGTSLGSALGVADEVMP